MDLESLIKSIDIVDFISQYVELSEKGGEWWGLSCFKDEHTPSFSVRRSPPFFYDYSSGIGGNVFSFVKKYYNCSSNEAVEILKKYAGCDGLDYIPKQKLEATNICKKYMKPKSYGKKNVSKILPESYMERYEKRWDKLAVWEKEGISKESLNKFQVYYDSFSDRIVYPIRNVDGDIVNIGGRSVDPEWKEKGLRKYCYFYSWGTVNTLYGIADNMKSIREKKEVILFEGCKSVLIADSWGFHNTAAVLTSHLNINQMKILAKIGCRVVFALDKDVRIRNDKNIQKLKRYVRVEYIWDSKDLLNEKDSPVDQGRETFLKLYNERLEL